MNRLSFILGRFCILAALTVAPWTGGGENPTVLLGLVGAILVGAFFALVALWTTPRRERRKNVYRGTLWASATAALGIAFCVFQIVPLSDDSLARFAPRVVELKRLLLPPDAPGTTLAEVSKPEFQPPENWGVDAAQETERFLSETFPFAEGDAKTDVRSALAVDAAVENELLAQDAPSRNAWGKTISVYPLASREKLIKLWAAALLFISTTVLFNTNSARRLFWNCVVVNGVAFALFCVATRANSSMFYTEKICRLLDIGDATRAYGSYAGKNSAGGYLVLVLSAAVSLFTLEFLKTVDALKEGKVDRRALELEKLEDSIYQHINEPLWLRIAGNLIDLFNRRLTCAFCVLAFLITAIFASLSRGASLAACVATAAAFLALGARRSARRYWPVLVGVLLIAAVGLTTTRLKEQVDDRMTTLVEEEIGGEGTALENDVRWENWRAALKTAEDYRWFGGGLGTYALTTRGGDVAMKKGKLFHHAENIFVETYLETGLVGLTILLAFLIGAFVVVFSMLGGRRGFETTAIATGGLALLLGAIVSSSGDFGIYFPANAFLFVALLGVAFGRQNVRFWKTAVADLKNVKTAPQALKRVARAERREQFGAAVLTLFVVGGLCGGPFALTETFDRVEREKLLRGAELDPETEMFAAISTVDEQMNAVRAYLERRDDCAELRALLATLAELRFKLAYWEEEAARGGSNVVEQNAWRATTPDRYAGLVLTYRRINFEKSVEAIQKNPIIESTFPQALSDLLAARRICPMFERTHEQIARFLPLAVDASFEREQEEIELCVRRAASLAPFNSGLLFRAGGVLYSARIEPLWMQFWQRSFEYSFESSDELSTAILSTLLLMDASSRIDEYVEQIVPNDAEAIRVAALKFSAQPKSRALAAIKTKGERFFSEIPEEDYDADLCLKRARFRQRTGALEEADEDFKRAIALVRPDTTEASFYRFYRGVFLCREGKSLNRQQEALELLEACDQSDYYVRKLPLDRWLKIAKQRLQVRQANDSVDAKLGVSEEEKDANAEVDESQELMKSIRNRMRELGVD